MVKLDFKLGFADLGNDFLLYKFANFLYFFKAEGDCADHFVVGYLVCTSFNH